MKVSAIYARVAYVQTRAGASMFASTSMTQPLRCACGHVSTIQHVALIIQVSVASTEGDDPNAGLPHVTAPMMAEPQKQAEFIATLKQAISEAVSVEDLMSTAETAFQLTVRVGRRCMP